MRYKIPERLNDEIEMHTIDGVILRSVIEDIVHSHVARTFNKERFYVVTTIIEDVPIIFDDGILTNLN